MQIHKIGKTLSGLLLMLALVFLAVVFLAAMNWLPSLREEGFARQYNSIEDAKRTLKLNDILVPAYFPEGLRWPPSFILAQKKPYQAVVMEFKDAKTKETSLIVIQSSLSGSDGQLQRIRLSHDREETRYRLKNKSVLLQVGMCDNGMRCSKMTWQDNGLFYTVLLTSSPFELIRIAESMIHS
ncbi:MAG: hypothetical protein M0R70_06830 [Nitrospirae bacterium]|nr:hypothetical protein [Nitrospirota bacterium]